MQIRNQIIYTTFMLDHVTTYKNSLITDTGPPWVTWSSHWSTRSVRSTRCSWSCSSSFSFSPCWACKSLVASSRTPLSRGATLTPSLSLVWQCSRYFISSLQVEGCQNGIPRKGGRKLQSSKKQQQQQQHVLSCVLSPLLILPKTSSLKRAFLPQHMLSFP